MTYWARSFSFEFDADGDPAAGAKLYFFDANTSTPRATYSDAALSTANTHPVVADGNGRWPAIFLQYGSYKEVATTSGGTTLWTVDNVPNPEPTDPETTVDENAIFQTGDYLFVGKNGSRTGFVRCNGTGIGSATSGAIQRANADCEDLFLYLWNNYGQSICFVSGGRGASAAADWAANKTISLPDHRGAAIIGFDDMGAGDSGQTDNAPVEVGSGILAGSILGANTHALTEAQLATHDHAITSQTTGAGGSHTHSFSATTGSGGAHTHTGTTDNGGVDHTHSVPDGADQYNITPDGGAADVAGTLGQTTGGASAYLHTHTFTTASDGAHTHSVSGTTGAEASHTHSLTGSTDNAGSGTAHNNLPRSVPVTVLMKL